jgi:hypothetical protein
MEVEGKVRCGEKCITRANRDESPFVAVQNCVFICSSKRTKSQVKSSQVKRSQ